MGSDYQFADINNGRAALRGHFTNEVLSSASERRGYSEFQAPANCFHLNRSRGDRSAEDRRLYTGVRFLHV